MRVSEQVISNEDVLNYGSRMHTYINPFWHISPQLYLFVDGCGVGSLNHKFENPFVDLLAVFSDCRRWKYRTLWSFRMSLVVVVVLFGDDIIGFSLLFSLYSPSYLICPWL
jgi:hypothetical protein